MLKIIVVLLSLITFNGIAYVSDNVQLMKHDDRFIIKATGKVRDAAINYLGYGCLVSAHDPINKYLPQQNIFTSLTGIIGNITKNIRSATDEEKSLCNGRQYWVVRDRGDQYTDNPVYKLVDGIRKETSYRVVKGVRCEGLLLGSTEETLQWMTFDGANSPDYVTLCEKVKPPQ